MLSQNFFKKFTIAFGMGSVIFNLIKERDMAHNSDSMDLDIVDKKAHPWRRCPMGKHFVRKHIAHVPPSKKHSGGMVTTVHEHCANNLSRKDELSYDEIQYITKTYFANLPGLPTAGALTKVYSAADDYDIEIRGWVKYWNDIFHLDDPLDPDLIKALIATESSFELEPEGTSAHGLMQIMNNTFKYLKDTKGELRNYLIRVTQKELLNASTNICAGVRWLFRKKETAAAKLKREASWEEAIIAYKDYWTQIEKGEIPEPIINLRKYYQILKEG